MELLKDNLRPGMKALDVGSGSGYLTACFALMVGIFFFHMLENAFLLMKRWVRMAWPWASTT